MTDIFGAGYSTNGGWVFHSQVDKDLLLGEIYPFDPAHVVPTTIKLGTALKMAGIGLSDGARRWVQTGGTDYGCMPEAAVTEGGPLVDVRCRWGATTVAEQAGNKLIVKNASLAIEGFNPATGVTTWTVSLADPTGQSEEAVFNRIEVVGEHTLLVPAAHGEMLIDPTTGATRLAPADTAAVCLVAIQVPLAGGQRTVAGTTTNNYVTGHQATRCTGTGTPASTATTAWPSWVGSTVNHVHVVTTDTGLQGYRQ